VADLYARPDVRPVFAALNQAASRTLQEFLGLQSAPEFHFESVDYVAGSLQLIVKPLSTMFGSSEAMIRFRDDVPWQQWLHRNFPKAQEKTADGLTYFEFSLPALGPSPSFVAARDGRTIVWSQSLDRLRIIAGKDAVHQTNPALASEWAAIGGGLITFVATDKRIELVVPSTAKPADLAASEILKHTRKYSWGLDLQPQTDAFVLKCSLNCQDESAAQSVERAVATLIPMAIGEMNDLWKVSPPQDFMADYLRSWKRLLENQTSNVVQRGDGSFAVEFESSATLPLDKLAIALGAENQPIVK
jgi:hypothetical protein